MARKNKIKATGLEVALKVINYVLLFLVALSMLYPFWEILVKSFMTDEDIISTTFAIWPKNWQFKGYEVIFTDVTYNIGRAFLNSIFVTFTDTVYQLAVTTMAAYALARKPLPGKKLFFFYFMVTMYFGGGLIPYYIVIRSLNLLNKIWVLIIPSFISVFNVLVMKAFFQGLPAELEEAAKIDGAGDFRVFTTIVLPLSKAILATIALFIAVGVWNNWFTTMLFIQDPKIRPLAYTLQVIIEKSRGVNTDTGSGVGATIIGESVQYAAIIVTVVPIIMVYPFLQKHFTKGVLVGSVKG